MSKWIFNFRFLDLPDGLGTVDLEEDKLILFAVIFGAIILLGLMIWGGVSAVRVLFLRKSKPEDFTEDAEVELPPLTELHAWLRRKMHKSCIQAIQKRLPIIFSSEFCSP